MDEFSAVQELNIRALRYLLILTECYRASLSMYQVCMDWHRIMRHPSLWSIIDLTSFPACCGVSPTQHQCTYLCYASYRHRLKQFLEYLIVIRPVMRTLIFALDIDDPADGYRCLLSELMRVYCICALYCYCQGS